VNGSASSRPRLERCKCQSSLCVHISRFLKVQIENEKLNLVEKVSQSDDFDADFGKIMPLLQDAEPCYIVIRLESVGALGDEFALLSYVPDGSKVQKRTLYASSRDSLKRSLGSSYFVNEMHGSSKSDFTLESWHYHLKQSNMSHAEKQKTLLTSSEQSAKSEVRLSSAETSTV